MTSDSMMTSKTSRRRFVQGAGALLSESGEPLPVRRGDTVLLPWEAGACHLEGDVVAVACRPPAAAPRGAA